MSELRLYPTTVSPEGDRCDGCAGAIAPSAKAVIRNDGAVFCAAPCAHEHDSGFIDPAPARSA